MKKRLSYLLTAIISIVVMLCSINVFAESETAVSKTEGELIGSVSIILEQPDTKHVYFGSYPQTEIVSAASQCGTYGKSWGTSSDYVVDATLYSTLQSATWDSNNDTTVEGAKYHRIKKSDATHGISGSAYYNWSDSTTYHYFKYEPIKWRILKLTENDAFLLSEGAIDNQKYNTTLTSITWEKSTVRSWLNSSFYNMAFAGTEKYAIKTTDVVNANNKQYGTAGGNNTKDKIFLLSEDEVYGSNATQYGFASSNSTYDTARQMKSSTYAKAMGVYSKTDSSYLGNCNWWLRSPGYYTYYAADVSSYGYVNQDGSRVDNGHNGILPALHINLKSNNPITACETITDITLSSDTVIYTGEEVKPSVIISGLEEGKDYTLEYSNNINVGTATVTVTGIGEWRGTISKTFEIRKDITQEGFILSKAEYTYSGAEIKPTVFSDKLSKDTDYSVSYSDNINVGTAKAIITGIGDYTGTKELEFTIIPQSIEDKEAVIDETDLTYSGQEKKPTVTIDGLKEETDFTVTYSNNINAGKASVTVTGLGNYTGTIEKNFTIEKQDISTKEVALNPEYCVYDGTEKTPTVSISGLSSATDYDVEYSNNMEIGTATVTVTGKGNYTGAISKNFKIGKDISNLEITISQDTYVYSGKENNPIVTIEGLEEGKDFTVGYVDNINAGTATAHVISMGEYVGYNSKTFTIKPYGFANESTTEGGLNTPVVLNQPEGDSKHVYFGSYPQTEIVSEASQCGTYGKSWGTTSDYIVDETLYSTLQSATWDKNGDTTIEGEKYHRITINDTTFAMIGSSNYYEWSNITACRYFKYEPIKWRILKITENDAFLLSEGAIDDQKYHNTRPSITWENSTVRSWLNNKFYNMAFSEEEQSAIKTTDVINANNKQNGTAGGNDTKDKIFLLSEDEVENTDYGFASSYETYDTARRMKSSTYAKAMGASAIHNVDIYFGNCYWWLRSPGTYTNYAAKVDYNGRVSRDGNQVDMYDYGIVPALHINLKSNNPITACEIITKISLSSYTVIYTGEEVKPSVTIDGLTEGTDYTVGYSNNDEIGTATVTVTGIGDCSGTITKTFEIIEGKDISLDKSEYTYDGTACCPKMTIMDSNDNTLVEGTDYDLQYSNNTNAGTGTVKAKLKGNYSGELTKHFTIKGKSIENMTATLSNTLYVYDGKAKEPKVTIEGLTEDTDFTVEYKNNTEAGQATATITGIGNYTGTITKNFRIGYVIEDNLVLSETEVLYDGTPKEPAVTWGSLVQDVDFTVEYSDNINVGTAKVKATGIGKYIGNDTKTFKIVSSDISSGYEINFNPGHLVYTGTALTPEISIAGLIKDTDYTVEYQKNNAVGDASVVLTGIGSYHGTVTKTFEIHGLTGIAAKEEKCTEAGNTAYWECLCDKYYSDAEGKTEIEKDSWIIEAKGHTLVNTEVKEPTCTEAGNSEYWTCSDCKKHFSDAEGKTEISKDSWIIDAKGHTMTKISQVKATHKKSGNTEYCYCSECKKYFSDEKGQTQIIENSWNVAQIDADSIALGKTEFTYDGTAKKPSVSVSDVDGKALSDETDYTVTYSDNTNVGMATAKITFTGNYSGSVEKNFEIKKAVPTYETPLGLAATYGDTLADVALPKGFAWEDSSQSVGNLGSNTFFATYTPTDTDNYKVLKHIELQVAVSKAKATSAKNIDAELEASEFVYDAQAKTPAVTVTTAKGVTLVDGNDYSVQYANNTNAGNATVVVALQGNYEGTIEKNFLITPADSSKVSVSLGNIRATYTGSEIKPGVTVTGVGSEKLVKGDDYTLEYSDNVKVGTAGVKVVLKGNYTGEVSKDFTITQADGAGLTMALSDTSYVYDGNAKQPKAIITGLDGKTLTEGDDYSMTYSNNTDAGTAKAEITFKGNYSGTAEKTFTIKALSVEIELLQTSFKYKGEAIEPEFELQASAGLSPQEGKDYTVEYSKNNAPGTGLMTVSFGGNYSGTITKEFEIIRTFNLTGSVTGCGDGNEATVTVKDEQGTETETTTESGSYTFKWLDGGNYTITVKGAGDFITHEYTKTLDDDYTEALEIRELGDTNCDGIRSAEDITRLARHIAKISEESDSYKLKLFNTDRNDELNAADITHLARFVAKIIDKL